MGEFFRSKHFFKNCGPYCIREPNRLEVDKIFFISFQAECNSAAQEPSRSPQHLNALLDVLLHPEKNIDDQVRSNKLARSFHKIILHLLSKCDKQSVSFEKASTIVINQYIASGNLFIDWLVQH